jgi:hypothetical protein
MFLLPRSGENPAKMLKTTARFQLQSVLCKQLKTSIQAPPPALLVIIARGEQNNSGEMPALRAARCAGARTKPALLKI